MRILRASNTGPFYLHPMTASFVHLRVHSEFALVDGMVRVKALAAACAEQEMGAVAITDPGNLFSAVKFFRACVGAGVKPIFGADVWIPNPQDAKHPFLLTLLCQNQTGYHNLACLISRGYREGQQQGVPTVKAKWVAEYSEGLIALSGARFGDIGHALLAKKTDLAEKRLQHWQQHFPNRFYLEIQRTQRDNEPAYNQAVVTLAGKTAAPLLATNDVRFISADDFEAHEARVCIHRGEVLADKRRARSYTPQQYLKSEAEMQSLFDDLPEALQNTVEIAKRCNLSLQLGKVFLPKFPTPDGQPIEVYLREQSLIGLDKRLAIVLKRTDEDAATVKQRYLERLRIELDVINGMGFPGYFLIVADFIQWAKNNGVPVGPGRGSGAGSLVAYALEITDVNPLDYDLLFERFLNPERVSMPDFDIDFCMEGRDRVIDYVTKRYGRDNVSQIITYGTMAARAVIRDVGRVLGNPYGFVDKLAKLIPFELGITLDKALEQEPVLKARYDDEAEVKTLFDLAQKLEGVTRNAGRHAGGVVIAPSKLTDFLPLYCEADSEQLVSQFDKDDVEAIGLVKFDFLGLRTLTIIDWAVKTVNAQQKEPIDITQIPLDDEKTFELLKECNTTAVFQLESRGMKDLIKRLGPDCFEEIVALVALFRPGPLQSGMVDDFIDRKHGRAKIKYPHPALEPILQPTYGVILYQEQVMQIAQVLAGYTLGGADMLRRAMGKKKAAEMAKQRAIFTEGAKNNDVKEKTATKIFDLMEKFAGYGFNKSHSVAYALIAYQTAWLKAHYPAAFMAAVLSSDMDNTDKVVNFLEDCKQHDLTVLPPTINDSAYRFTVNKSGEIVYGLGAIKGVGEAALTNIFEVREKTGPFSDLFALCQAVETRKVNRRVLEALTRCGAFDSFGQHRAALLASVDDALKAAEQHTQNTNSGQDDLFGCAVETTAAETPHYQACEPWSDEVRLQHEKDTLGFYLTGHPIDFYQHELSQLTTNKIVDLQPEKDQMVKVAGLVVAARTMQTKRGNRMGFITLDDNTARIEIAVFPEKYDKYREFLVKDKLLIVTGEVSVDDYSGGFRMSTEEIVDMQQARDTLARCILLRLNKQPEAFADKLKATLKPYRRGRCPVFLEYLKDDKKAVLNLGDKWLINLDPDLIRDLTNWLGREAVEITY